MFDRYCDFSRICCFNNVSQLHQIKFQGPVNYRVLELILILPGFEAHETDGIAWVESRYEDLNIVVTKHRKEN